MQIRLGIHPGILRRVSHFFGKRLVGVWCGIVVCGWGQMRGTREHGQEENLQIPVGGSARKWQYLSWIFLSGPPQVEPIAKKICPLPWGTTREASLYVCEYISFFVLLPWWRHTGGGVQQRQHGWTGFCHTHCGPDQRWRAGGPPSARGRQPISACLRWYLVGGACFHAGQPACQTWHSAPSCCRQAVILEDFLRRWRKELVIKDDENDSNSLGGKKVD